MDFNLSEEHLMIRDAARDFAKTELLPGVIERDNEQRFPTEQVKKMAELGFLGMMVDPKYGGSGMDATSYVLVMEELSKIDASASVMVSVNNSLVCYGLESYANEAQKEKYLTKLATGEFLGAFCLSEPEAGSDATSQSTTAIDNGDHYILNGTKNWITNGGRSDVYLVIAQTDKEKGHKGINAFIVEKGTPGFTVARLEKKLGIRASDTATLIFDNCRIPRKNLLGGKEEIETDINAAKKSFGGAMQTFDNTRPMVAGMAIGLGQAALDMTRALLAEEGYVDNFGGSMHQQTAIQNELEMLEAELEAARLLVYKSAWMMDNKLPNSKEASMGKAKAGRIGNRISLKCVEICSMQGFSEDHLLEKFSRDSKILDIFEGTQQIQQLIVARQVLGKSSSELK